MGARIRRPGIEPLRDAAAFQRLLRTPPCIISAHFAIHHLAKREETPDSAANMAVVRQLSTDASPDGGEYVDDQLREAVEVSRHAFAVVVPKRHARRAVTRSLLKREMRAAFAGHVPRLDPGAWLMRLRAGFDRSQYPSAASLALRKVVRTELAHVLEDCATKRSPERR